MVTSPALPKLICYQNLPSGQAEGKTESQDPWPHGHTAPVPFFIPLQGPFGQYCLGLLLCDLASRKANRNDQTNAKLFFFF